MGNSGHLEYGGCPKYLSQTLFQLAQGREGQKRLNAMLALPFSLLSRLTQVKLFLRVCPRLSQLLVAGMHIELVGRVNLGMSGSYSEQFWSPSMFGQTGERAVTQQVSMSINAGFPFQPLKQIVDVGVLQRLTRACTMQ